MTANLFNNNHDGANHQAQAVLAMVRYLMGDGIESSWDNDIKRYLADPRVHRYDNCREQGYVVYMRGPRHADQINIAFYEHRNSDCIYVQVVEALTPNAPTLDVITSAMETKWSGTSFNVGDIMPAAAFISRTLQEFWERDRD